MNMNAPKQESPSFKLDLTDLWVVIRNAIFVALAAFLTVIINSIGELDLGQYTVILIPIVTVILDTILKWLKDNTNSDDDTAPDGE